MLTYVEAGGEKWLPWARRKAASLVLLARELDLASMLKAFKPDSGTLVIIKVSLDGPTMIRITAGSASRIRITDIGGNPVNRFYRMKGGSLDGYGEAGALSFDGRSSVGYNGASALIAERKNKAQATDPATFFALTAPPPLSSQTPAHSVEVTDVWPLQAPWTNEAGSFAVAVRGVSGCESPIIYSLGSDTTSTLLTAVSTTRPAWLSAFYTGQSVPHRLREVSEFSSNTVLLDRRGAAVGDHYLELMPVDALGVVGPGGATASYYALYDRFGDQVAMYARLPYVSAPVTSVPVAPAGNYDTTVVMGERHELRAYSYATGLWSTVYAVSRPNLATFTYTTNAAQIAASGDPLDGVQVLKKAANMTPLADWDSAPVKQGTLSVYPASNLKMPLCLMELVRPIAADNTQRLLRNGVVVKSDVPINSTGAEFTPQLALEARDARVLAAADTLMWYGAWGGTNLGVSSLGAVAGSPVVILSPLGERLYVHNTTWAYYESGVLKQTVAAVPTANAASFALYPTAPAAGFWFIQSIVGWLHDKTDTVKASVYTHVSRATINPPPHIPPFPPITVYTWHTAVVKLKLVDGALKVIETYSTASVPVASRGPLTETLPGVTSVFLDDATLIQDALLQRST